MKFLLTVIIFIGLKLWELLKFFTWKPVKFLIKHWEWLLGIIVLIVYCFLLSEFIFWGVKYFGVTPVHMLLYCSVGMVFCVLIGMILSINKIKINRFFADNWREAKRISNNISP